jgi:hypothetical protein
MTLHYDVQLQARGRLVRMEWDRSSGLPVECEVPPDEFPCHLHGHVCLARNVLLGDLLALVSYGKDMFSCLTACDCLDELLDEQAKGTPVEMVALEFAWSAELVPVGQTAVLDSSVEFYGIGKDGERLGLEFTPACHLAGLPIVLNEAFNIHEGAKGSIFSTTRRFTLLDIVSSSIGELTFLGSPEERDEALDDLNERIRSADDGEFHTVDEVRAEWERRSEEDRSRFPCRMCGSDSRCACFGKPEGICHACFGAMKEN